MKNKIINAIMVIVSTVAGLLLSELFLRFTWTPWEQRNVISIQDHPVFDFAPIPGISGAQTTPEYTYHFSHSQQGLRHSPIFDTHKKMDEKRILLLGDSFTYGVGANDDETFAGRLQANLPQYQFANAGCNGYGTRNVLSVLDFLGPELKPDIIIYFFFWNDLSDNMKRTIPEFKLEESGKVTRVDALQYEYNPLHIFEPVSAQKKKGSAFYLVELISEGFKSIRYKYWGMRLPYIYEPAEMKSAWEVTEEYLRMLKIRSGELNAILLTVALPDHNQVNPKAIIKNIKPYLFEIQEPLKAICLKHQIDFYDLLPEMKSSWEKEQTDYFYYADRHLTPEGNRVAASQIQLMIENRVE